MKNKIAKHVLGSLLAIAFWLLVWEAVARSIDVSFIFPSVREVFSEFFALFVSKNFYATVFASFLRILCGFSIGILLGTVLAPLTKYFMPARVLISPVMTVLRATPVASFIMVLWLIIGSDAVPVTITAFMVTPIVWQNLSDGFSAIDPALDEVCAIYRIKGLKRLRILVIPTLIKYLIPGIITSAGLAWKSGIAAEIIAYTSNSIGKEIYLAKAYLESGKMLAWTMIVIIFSLIFEALLSLLGRRVANGKSKA